MLFNLPELFYFKLSAIFIFLSLLNYFIYKKNGFLNFFKNCFNINKAFFLFFLCLIVGLVCSNVFLNLEITKPQLIDVKIEPLVPEDNDLSRSEVIIVKVLNNGKEIPLENLIKNGNWEIKDGLLYSKINSNERNYIHFKDYVNKLEIHFISHPWSGAVSVHINNDKTFVNLRSNDSTSVSFAYNLQEMQNKNDNIIVILFKSYLSFSIISLTFFLIFIINKISLKENPKQKNNGFNKYTGLLLISILIFTYFIYTLSFWPGFFTSDTFDQLGQIQSGFYNNHHPLIHTLYLKLFYTLFNNLGFMIVFQVILFSTIIGKSFKLINKLGFSSNFNYIFLTLFYLIPINFYMITSGLKDSAYSLIYLILFLILFKITLNVNSIDSKKTKLLYLLNLLLLSLIRHNGLIVSIIIQFTLIGFYKNKPIFKKLLIIFLIIVFTINLLITKIANSKSLNDSLSSQVSHYGYGVLLKGGNLSKSEIKFLNNTIDYNYAINNYNPEWVGWVTFSSHFNKDFVNQNRLKVYKNFLIIGLKNPMKYLIINSELNSLIWNTTPKRLMVSSSKTNLSETQALREIQRDFNVIYSPKIKDFADFWDSIVLNKNYFLFKTWVPVFYIYVFLLFGFLIFYLDKKLRLLLIFYLLNILSVIPFGIFGNIRYLYPNILILPYFIILFFNSKKCLK